MLPPYRRRCWATTPGRAPPRWPALTPKAPHAAMLGGYIGKGDTFSMAILDWSYAYADKTLDDYHQLKAAAKAGEIDVAADPLR